MAEKIHATNQRTFGLKAMSRQISKNTMYNEHEVYSLPRLFEVVQK